MMANRRKCNYHPFIDSYMDDARNGTILVGKDILLAMDYLEEKLNNSDVFIDHEKIEKAVELMERYFQMKLLDWELFVTACIHCYYKSDDTVVFNEIFLMMGRGNGKNGFISPLVWYLTTHYHGIQGYNVDIVANSEEQAETSFQDVYEMLERTWPKSKKFFYKSKQLIKNLKTKSYIKFNTSNARTKDGKRTACLVFDEIHEYERYDMISVFTSGFGKRKHSRAFYITTNGHVRDGVLDDKLVIAESILNGINKNLGILPLIYRIDKEEEAQDPAMWHKANPSLRFFPELKKVMDTEFVTMQDQASVEQEFFTKRLNWPKGNRDLQVTDWENISATNEEIPDMTGWSCTVGIDYAKINDWASVNFHFKKGEQRYDINHSWFCLRSADLKRLQIPWKDWARLGYITLVEDVEIHPRLLGEYIAEMATRYNIKMIALDNNRYALVSSELKKIGFDWKDYKNVKLVRPNDIYKVQTIMDSCFTRHLFTWGDAPPLRWATNNAKRLSAGKKDGTETGNYYYGKIEPKSRKTDPFMALVHAMVVEDALESGGSVFVDLPVIT